jgi:hypothetical protein
MVGSETRGDARRDLTSGASMAWASRTGHAAAHHVDGAP